MPVLPILVLILFSNGSYGALRLADRWREALRRHDGSSSDFQKVVLKIGGEGDADHPEQLISPHDSVEALRILFDPFEDGRSPRARRGKVIRDDNALPIFLPDRRTVVIPALVVSSRWPTDHMAFLEHEFSQCSGLLIPSGWICRDSFRAHIDDLAKQISIPPHSPVWGDLDRKRLREESRNEAVRELHRRFPQRFPECTHLHYERQLRAGVWVCEIIKEEFVMNWKIHDVLKLDHGSFDRMQTEFSLRLDFRCQDPRNIVNVRTDIAQLHIEQLLSELDEFFQSHRSGDIQPIPVILETDIQGLDVDFLYRIGEEGLLERAALKNIRIDAFGFECQLPLRGAVSGLDLADEALREVLDFLSASDLLHAVNRLVASRASDKRGFEESVRVFNRTTLLYSSDFVAANTSSGQLSVETLHGLKRNSCIFGVRYLAQRGFCPDANSGFITSFSCTSMEANIRMKRCS